MPDSLPPLSSFRCFEAAARLESFSRAGDELHLTHGAISRQIRIAEETLGVKLFQRRNRRVFLTEAGRNLLAAVQAAFARLNHACEEIRERSPTPLVLSCERSLVQRWLIPRLSQLQRELPEVILHVLAAGGPVSFERSRIDYAIRRNDTKWGPSIYPELFLPEEVGPVCCPKIAGKEKEKILQQPIIHTSVRPDAWDQWLVSTRRRTVLGRPLWFEHFYLSITAAIAGLGVALAPRALVLEEIKGGTLVAPFGFKPTGFGYYLLSKRPFKDDPRAQGLLKWLRKMARRK